MKLDETDSHEGVFDGVRKEVLVEAIAGDFRQTAPDIDAIRCSADPADVRDAIPNPDAVRCSADGLTCCTRLRCDQMQCWRLGDVMYTSHR